MCWPPFLRGWGPCARRSTTAPADRARVLRRRRAGRGRCRSGGRAPPASTTRIALRDDGGARHQYELTSSYTPVADRVTSPTTPWTRPRRCRTAARCPRFSLPGDAAARTIPRPTTTTTASRRSRARCRSGSTTSRAIWRRALFLFRADGSEVARVSNGMRGAALALTPPAVTDATDFVVRVSLWDEAPAAAGRGDRAAGELHAALPADGVASAAVTERGESMETGASGTGHRTGGAKAASAAKSGRGCRACSSSCVAKIIERS